MLQTLNASEVSPVVGDEAHCISTGVTTSARTTLPEAGAASPPTTSRTWWTNSRQAIARARRARVTTWANQQGSADWERYMDWVRCSSRSLASA